MELFELDIAETTDSKLHLLMTPWELTTSYGQGTANGPIAIQQASSQLDFFDIDFGDCRKAGISASTLPDSIAGSQKVLAKEVEKIRDGLEGDTKGINQASDNLNNWVYNESKKQIAAGKIPGLIGGDHSCPYGLIKALSEKHSEFGILHIDAHADLRNAYQGFTHSHASIMYNVVNLKNRPQKLVQVGIRDFCKEEYDIIDNTPSIKTFFDRHIFEEKSQGANWASITKNIINELPENVYISFDIDGLSPEFCANTGTPVPGGLSFNEVSYLIKQTGLSKKIIGFDLVEVAPGKDSELDANIGARLLYQLCGWSLKSQGHL